MNDQPPPRDRPSEPLLDDVGTAIVAGKETTEFLWQVPNDEASRVRLSELLVLIRDKSAKKGRREMPRICDDLLKALEASPTPQQVDLLQDGFDRLYKLWSAAKSGLL
jgi:hypothetical protein